MSSGAIDVAIVARLAGDATLAGLAPGGVFRDVAPQGVVEPFVVVTQAAHEDEYQFRGLAWESYLYAIKAVHGATSGASAQSAADRIHALMQDASPTIAGFRTMLIQRDSRIAYVEVDDRSDRRYQHRGGLYRVVAEPSA